MSDDLTRLTDEEREWMTRPLPTGTSTRELSDEQAEAVVFRAAGLLAARTAALIERAERAERERDGWREEAKSVAFTLGRSGAQLAALRAAVTGLADEWEERAMTCCSLMCQNCGGRYIDPDELRDLLTDEGDNQ